MQFNCTWRAGQSSGSQGRGRAAGALQPRAIYKVDLEHCTTGSQMAAVRNRGAAASESTQAVTQPYAAVRSGCRQRPCFCFAWLDSCSCGGAHLALGVDHAPFCVQFIPVLAPPQLALGRAAVHPGMAGCEKLGRLRGAVDLRRVR